MNETPSEYGAILDALERAGDPRKSCKWPEGDPDYVRTYGLGPEHVPALIEIAREWVTRQDWPDDENDMTVYAPVHAWRALGQLRAAEAVEPLLGMIRAMDEQDDDWYLEEFPDAFALIGPAATGPVAAYLTDASNGMFPRIGAAHGLCKIAQRHGETRDETVAQLSACLAAHEEDDYTLNAFLVSYLLDLKAVESAELMERAYAAGRIDYMVCGYWGKVRAELGVQGLGLAPDEPPGPRPRFPFFRAPAPRGAAASREPPDTLARPVGPQQLAKGRDQVRAKRKRQRADRRRNRRRRR